jgi:hypothetical protein
MVSYGGIIFRTTPLTFEMHLTCYCFGFGSLIVGAVLKKMKDEWVTKLERVPFKESSHEPAGKKDAKPKTKGETTRLLDSN